MMKNTLEYDWPKKRPTLEKYSAGQLNPERKKKLVCISEETSYLISASSDTEITIPGFNFWFMISNMHCLIFDKLNTAA